MTSDKLAGALIEWNEAKGYGFIDDGKRRIFAHIRDFTERPHAPKPGDKVTYTLGTDRQGRPCAQNIYLPFKGRPLSPAHLVTVAVLLVAPGWALGQLFEPDLAGILASWVVLASGISYGLYARDKRYAQEGAWRFPEWLLHFWALLGGWPGGFLAQRRLRHKSTKLRFLYKFWLIVLLHQYLAIDALLDWQLFDRCKTWLAGSL
ncbi:MAG: DUF1294 domain-containing protein [Rariglobus sp.]